MAVCQVVSRLPVVEDFVAILNWGEEGSGGVTGEKDGENEDWIEIE